MNLTFSLVCFFNIIVFVQSLEILTTLGPVRGKLVDDVTTGAYYYRFTGIPYAESPVGNLRFKPPVQKRPWSSVYDATKPGSVCPQTEVYYSRNEMNEDCLNFNVYTPANFESKLLPVMFYIHDGDFKLQSGNAEPIYGPQLLILNNVVVVTVNYRLGALGFLSLCNEEVPGNAGVKDVLLALKIINNNIRRFGGDPKKVTVMGNGAGAAIAQLLMLTNKSNGYFRTVILHCASVLSPKFIDINPRKNAKSLLLQLGIEKKSNHSILRALKSVDAFDIVSAQEDIERMDPQRGYYIFSAFKPTVEIPNESAIITRAPLDMIKEGAIRDIPMFIGFNNQEGLEIFPLLRSEPELIDRLNENFELCVPPDIKYPYGSEERRDLSARIRQFYFGGGNISFINVQNHINLISDSQYTFAIDFFVRLFKQRKKSSVYYYVLETDGDLNWFKKFANITYPGAAHNDDLGYPFLTSITKSIYNCLDVSTKKAQDAILLDIKTFLYHGAPTPNSIVNCWPEAGQERYHLTLAYDALAIFERPIPERIDFWTEVYQEYLNSTSTTRSYFCAEDCYDKRFKKKS